MLCLPKLNVSQILAIIPMTPKVTQCLCPITFEAEFQNFGLLYYKTTDGKTGIVKIEIDGVPMRKRVIGDFPDGWGDYPASVELYTSSEVKKHTVTITVTSSLRLHFEILALLLS